VSVRIRAVSRFKVQGSRRHLLYGPLERDSIDRGPIRVKNILRPTVSRSVGQSVLVSGTHLGPATDFFPSLFNYFMSVMGLLMLLMSDERSGL
jgi:hypothetical protein